MFVASCFHVKAQDSIWFKQSKVGEVIAFEKAIAPSVSFLNQNVGLSEDYYPLYNKYKVTNPIIAKRESINSLPVYAQYYFTPNDSLIRLISYDWEKSKYGNYFDKLKIWEKEADSLEVYNKTYESVRAQLIAVFGKPAKTDNSPKKKKSDRGNYLTRESTWELKDVYLKLIMTFESMTYRVRMTYYWKE